MKNFKGHLDTFYLKTRPHAFLRRPRLTNSILKEIRERRDLYTILFQCKDRWKCKQNNIYMTKTLIVSIISKLLPFKLEFLKKSRKGPWPVTTPVTRVFERGNWRRKFYKNKRNWSVLMKNYKMSFYPQERLCDFAGLTFLCIASHLNLIKRN